MPALALKEPALTDPGLLATPGGQSAMIWAVLLELILAAACVGTAVVLYPVIRRHGEAGSLGFVAARITEGALILLGVIALYSLVVVPRDAAADAVLIALHDGAFLLGPGLIPAANALLLGSVLYRSRLVPRILPVIGFVGAGLLTASVIGTLFGLFDQVSAFAAIAAVPVAFWEIGLGLWLVIKGFRPVPLVAEHPASS